MSANHCVPLFLFKAKEHLTTRLQTEIPADDVTRADNVKLGRLQENKTKKNIQIGITHGDPDDPELLDGIVTLDKLPDIGMVYPEREIGGGQIWMRRGIARIECFFVAERLLEEDAFLKAWEVMGRLTQAIEEIPVNEIPRDSFGERPISVHCYASSFSESGGGKASYIFRGKAHWAIFTDKTSGIKFI